MTSLIAEKYEVRIFPTNPDPGRSGISKHWQRFERTIRAALSIFINRKKYRVCYFSGEGSLGIIYNIILVTTAILAGSKPIVHHHNYNYIDRKSILMIILHYGMVRTGTHIFLSGQMEAAYRAKYGSKGEFKSIRNSAFVPPISQGSLASPIANQSDVPVIGLLSNLTKEKGLYIFLDVLRNAVKKGIPVRGVLAGPVGLADDRRALEEARLELGNCLDYRGPLYGPEKDNFYLDTDVFLFPTSYANEAQPTVLFEALAAGCQVISYDRGCISDQIGSNGLLVTSHGNFVTTTLSWLQNWKPERESSRRNRIDRYNAEYQSACEDVRFILDDLIGGALKCVG